MDAVDRAEKATRQAQLGIPVLVGVLVLLLVGGEPDGSSPAPYKDAYDDGPAMPFKLIALVLPLSLDTFAVSAALGVAGLPARDRWRLSLILCGFEAVMPIVGVIGGAMMGRALGDFADYLGSR